MYTIIRSVILSLVVVTNLVYAGGAITVIATPPDAEIYVDGTLKANTTPAYLKLPAGTYQIQVKRAGWETQKFPVVLADEVALVKRIQLVEAKPVVIDLKAMLFPVRDPFETEEEFAARRQLIIKQFNDAVAKHDLSYRAGIAKLKKERYNIKAQTFPLEITWDAWATQFKLATSGQLTIPRDQARSLWNEGAEKSVFLLFELSATNPTVAQVSILGIQQSWEIKFPHSEPQITAPFEPEMVDIPAGSFKMGSPSGESGRNDDEGPVHTVQIRAFRMGKYEVTNAQFRKFRPNHDSGKYKGRNLNGDNQPVVNVSWEDAVAYTEWLAKETGKPYRLPTEAEWEYAARAGTTTARFWGNDPDQACTYANVADETAKSELWWFSFYNCTDGHTVAAPVGSYSANPWGLHDMLGNVWEWTCSQYDSNGYSGKETTCANKGNSDARAVRGGSWVNGPVWVRAAVRDFYSPSFRVYYFGFRLVQD